MGHEWDWKVFFTGVWFECVYVFLIHDVHKTWALRYSKYVFLFNSSASHL